MDKTNKLKQEIEEYLTKDYCCEFKEECKDGIRIRCSEYEAKLYLILRFAEPREKRIAELEAQIEKMKNWSNCKNYQECLIELAEQGKGMNPSECCVNCKKWEIKDYKTRKKKQRR